MEMDASSVTMDARAIEIVITDEADNSRHVNGTKKASIWKRIGRVLIDNRMKGKPDCERVLRGHPEENIFLKRVLNIVFIIIGVCLLVAVFIVIIYTSIVGDKDYEPDPRVETTGNTQSPTTDSSNDTLTRFERLIKEYYWEEIRS